MTTELEKQFFDTFEIKPEKRCGSPILKIYNSFACIKTEGGNCDDCVYQKEFYPQITVHHYLTLILIYSQIRNLPICYGAVERFDDDAVERFKEAILEGFIENSKDYKHQVQELFKGE